MLRLDECDIAIAGGVSESIHTFGIFASFKSQGALAAHEDPSKLLGLLIAIGTESSYLKERACMFSSDFRTRRSRNATIIAEIVSYAINTDATDFVLPNPERQAQCIDWRLKRGG